VHAQRTLQADVLRCRAAPPPHCCSSDALCALVESVALSVDDSLSAEDVADLARALWRRLEAARIAADAAQLGTDALEAGCCELCERRMPLTKHHLIPRSQHAAYRAKGFSEACLAQTLRCCRQCHNALHDAIDEPTLAAHYNTAAALLRHEGVHRFVAWASKQRGRADSSHHLQHKR
jgi:hypothetical protein